MQKKVRAGFQFTKENMTKTILKEVGKDAAPIIVSKQHIDIQFKEDAFADYNGTAQEYSDIKGYSLNGPYLVVQLHDNTQYVYPMDSVAVLKLFSTQE